MAERHSSSHHQGMTLLLSSWKVIGVDRNKVELRKEKRSSVILSKPHVLVSGSALGWGMERAIVLSGKQSSQLQRLLLLSPGSFFFFFP